MSYKTAPGKTAPKETLSPGTLNIIDQIENKEIRDQLLLGLHPQEVVDGWYYALSSQIVKMQRNNTI
jgi:hypothetical protein